MRAVTFVLLLAVALPAQRVSVANYTNQEYLGWVPVSTAWPGDREQAKLDNETRYVLGRRVGKQARMMHVHLRLGAGEVRTLDFATAQVTTDVHPRMPADVIANPLGVVGRPVVSGIPLSLVELRPDGASFLVHFRGRLTPMLQAELWCQWYPDQPWASIELGVWASNAERADLGISLPADLRLEWSPGTVMVRGATVGAPLLPAGEWIGDGQGRAWTGTVVWTERLRTTDAWTHAGAWFNGPILGMGDWRGRFGPAGVPGDPPAAGGFDAMAWFRTNSSRGILNLHNWREHQLGVAASSGQTGAQEDQGFTKGSEAFLVTGAWWPRYLAALGFARRPCHHLGANGLLLDLERHPRLVFWDGRPHWHTSVSPDQLGIPAGSRIEWHRWSGPDRQHWLLNTVGAARLLSGSPLLEYLLRHQANLILGGETTKAGLSTSNAGADRGVGWTALAICWVLEGLDDRTLAAKVEQRARDRVRLVLLPQLGRAATLQVTRWSTHDDGRLWQHLNEEQHGYTGAWMAYQLAVGAGGLQILGEYLDIPEARQLALLGARAVVDYAYTRNESTNRWTEWEIVAELRPGEPLPASHYVQGQGVHRTGWFRYAWMPWASWVVLRHTPNDARARSIYDQLRSEMLGGSRPLDWLPPLR